MRNSGFAGPIRPEDVVTEKAIKLPDEVFQAFNGLIAERWDGKASTFTQEEVVVRIIDLLVGVGRSSIKTRDDVFKNHWLDVEQIYKSVGWKVQYDKPGYNEVGYKAKFIFRKDK